MKSKTKPAIAMFDIQLALHAASSAIQSNLAAMHAAGQYIGGAQVANFEGELAAAFGSEFGVGCGSGTAALELCLRAAGITSPEDEVIVPANTSLFTAQAVLAAGASIRIADVDPCTLLLSQATVERALTPKVRAVIAVHLFGHGAPLSELAALCRARGVVLIQDACQAHGLRVEGRPLTSYSDYTAYSFYPTKNLGCLGDGGAVVSDSPEIAAGLRLLRDGGRAGDQLARIPAINSRLDELHACYLRAFLPHLESWNKHRRLVSEVYDSVLCDGPCQPVQANPDDVHHLYVIRAPRRNELRAWLAEHDIATGIHYAVPLHQHPAFAGRMTMPAPPAHAVEASQQILSLPIGAHVDVEMALRVGEEIARFYQ